MAPHEKDENGHAAGHDAPHGAGGASHGGHDAGGGGHGGHGGEHGHEEHEEGHGGPHEEKPPGAPGWIVSFADMIINLLCFFILMNTFASRQEAGLIADGLGSFRGVGIGGGGPNAMSGGEVGSIDLGAGRVRYRPPKALNTKMLTAPKKDEDDTNRDSLRETTKHALKGDGIVRIPVEIIFAPGSSELTDEQKTALDIIGPILKTQGLTLRIDGYAYAEPCESIRGMAVRRAQTVRKYLVEKCGVDDALVNTIGYGSSGTGKEKHANRVVQDQLGRRIAVIYVIPKA